MLLRCLLLYHILPFKIQASSTTVYSTIQIDDSLYSIVSHWYCHYRSRIDVKSSASTHPDSMLLQRPQYLIRRQSILSFDVTMSFDSMVLVNAKYLNHSARDKAAPISGSPNDLLIWGFEFNKVIILLNPGNWIKSHFIIHI